MKKAQNEGAGEGEDEAVANVSEVEEWRQDIAIRKYLKNKKINPYISFNFSMFKYYNLIFNLDSHAILIL